MSAAEVPIRDQSIRLSQFLKLADLIEAGSDAKWLCANGDVEVNGEVETRRGRQLVPGDVVDVAGRSARGGARVRVLTCGNWIRGGLHMTPYDR